MSNKQNDSAADAAGNDSAADAAGKKIRVVFKTTYVGTLGCFQKGSIYKIDKSTYAALKNDCEKTD